MSKNQWKCPRCSAPWKGHGKGECKNAFRSGLFFCEGLCCACDVDTQFVQDHGLNRRHECKDAQCDHCGWKGVMPPKKKARKR